MFVEGCQRDWERPAAPRWTNHSRDRWRYVHAKDETNHKAGTFEVIVGKVITTEGFRKASDLSMAMTRNPKDGF